MKAQKRMPELIPIQTRRLDPPKDSLSDALASSALELRDGDVVVLSSKVVAIDEGRCVLKSSTDKTALVQQEADCYIPKSYNKHGFELSIIHHALIASAGVDASNCGDYFTLLPQKPFLSAQHWHNALCEKFKIKNLGVIIADSHCIPMRCGVVDISIGFWGLRPLKDYRGTDDLFGQKMLVSQGNIVDALAAAAGAVMGQGQEQVPVVVARNWPNLDFDGETNYQDQFVIDPSEDIFNIMLDVFYQKGIVRKA
jgi:F420-0:gamma-glutamyl ligase